MCIRDRSGPRPHAVRGARGSAFDAVRGTRGTAIHAVRGTGGTASNAVHGRPRFWRWGSSQRLGNGPAMLTGGFSGTDDYSEPFRTIVVILGPTPYLRRTKPCLKSRHLSCLNSRHLSCLSSRHLSCLNSRHLSCLNRRHLAALGASWGDENDFDLIFTPKMRKMEHARRSRRTVRRSGNATTGRSAKPHYTRADGEDYVGS